MRAIAGAVLALLFVAPAACGGAPAGGPTSAEAAEASCQAPPRRHPDSRSAAYRRHNEVQSDSLWLIERVRRRYADRLAAAYVAGADDPGGLRLVIRLTGTAPIPPMRLADRAEGVPVTIEYGAPHSLREVAAIRQRVHDRVVALLPTLQGVGYDEAAGTIHLDVYAPDEAARRAALARCEALRSLYRMPVRIEVTDAMMDLGAPR